MGSPSVFSRFRVSKNKAINNISLIFLFSLYSFNSRRVSSVEESHFLVTIKKVERHHYHQGRMVRSAPESPVNGSRSEISSTAANVEYLKPGSTFECQVWRFFSLAVRVFNCVIKLSQREHFCWQSFLVPREIADLERSNVSGNPGWSLKMNVRFLPAMKT